ncbi:MAG: hypothetical protein JWP16_1478 [Alphaproteobacteria bacterium]|jgi:hypothetical protein|nr:hypothetical protein [Alphaproteobacteria bacterium]MDB5740438.1 hypothetical protein [Alphaproteobacteria bacterium]
MLMRLAILALLAVLVLPFEPDLGLGRSGFMASLDKVRRERLVQLRAEIHADRMARRGRSPG